MMTIEDLPELVGGTIKQKMYAEDLRMRFINYTVRNRYDAEEIEPVLGIRVLCKWWIDNTRYIDMDVVGPIIRAAAVVVKRHGSVEAAAESIRKAERNKQEASERRKQLSRPMALYDPRTILAE